jgi:hypothetical protein
MRHIPSTFLISTLRRGAVIEQFMGGRVDGSQRVIRWIRLSPNVQEIEVWDQEVSDFGGELWDSYALSDEDQEAVAVFSDPAEAIEFAQSVLGALPERWVNEGIGESEFLDYVALNRPVRWPPGHGGSSS